ncbi:hypothetical protein ANCCEY_06677 [Ancylostoma ceylanicum]|uniref:SCP domain-containing protein n=1 Tax=Ancylostoma ceylanicum TaxID=53326 RepID=A0A0D6LSU0_9BILA|nr:hypothetical protein ANCCEY_06677 [Ancylostoma ceylanicum]
MISEHGKMILLLYWNCDLEKQAIDTLAKGCYTHDNPPTTTDGKAQIFEGFYPQGGTADSTILKTFIAGALQYIDYMELEGVNPGDSTVIYKGNSIDSLLPYFTLMQPTATEIGCAYRQCTETTSGLINTYCILNSKSVKAMKPTKANLARVQQQLRVREKEDLVN